MAVEDDILKVLQRIEKAFGNSSATIGGGGGVNRRVLPTGQSVGADSAKAQQLSKKDQADQSKHFKATTKSLTDLGDVADALGKQFNGLGKTVFNTRANFVQMNRSMRAYVKGVAGGASGGGGETISQADVKKAAAGPARTGGRTGGGGGGGGVLDLLHADAGGSGVKRILGSVIQQTFKPAGQMVKTAEGDTVEQILSFGKKYEVTAASIVGVGTALVKAVKPLAEDFLFLQSQSFNAGSSMIDLYKNAAAAGMSLKDYTKLLQENNSLLTRSASIDDFNKKIQGTVQSLNSFGIFGEQATALAATFANSATMVGVAQGNLDQVSRPLEKMFETLATNVGLTADQFREMTKTLADNEDIQDSLIGLAKKDRAARFVEYVQTQTLGLAMGGTVKQSNALAQALLDQRKASVQDTFQQSGTLSQAGAIFGMDPGQIEAARRISLKSEATQTEQEKTLLANVTGELDQRLSAAENSNDLNTRNIAQSLRAGLGNLGKIGQARARIGLAADSGDNQGVNKDFTRGVDKFGEFVGQLTTWGKGLAANPIAEAIIGGVTSGLTTLIGTKVGANIFGRIFGKGTAAATGDAANVGKFFTESEKAAQAATTAGAEATAAAEGAAATGEAAVAVDAAAVTASTGIGTALGTFGKILAKGPIIAAFVDGIEEAFTGALANALDPNGGLFGRIEGVAIAAFSAIPQMLIDALSWAIGPDALKPIQHYFDMFKTGLAFGINTLIFGLLHAISFVTDLLPKDSGLRKMVENGQETFAAAMSANEETMAKLQDGNDKTLKEVGDANKAAAKVATTTASAATANIQQAAGVLTSTNNLAGSVLTTAQGIAASPAAQTRPSVNSGAVNTPANGTNPDGTPAIATAPGTTTTGAPAAPDMPTQLAQVIQLLTKMLDSEQAQASGLTSLASALGRPTFTDNTAVAANLIM